VNARRVVVVGAGHAGFTLCATLRTMHWDGEITLIDADQTVPYQRPPLSKKVLSGEQEFEDNYFRPLHFYEDHGIKLLRGQHIAGIDRNPKVVEIEGHPPLHYDHLVLATGARPRELPVAGLGPEHEGVCHLHTAAHGLELRERIPAAERVVIIGGGFIGLEAASMAAKAGKEVVVFEADIRLMGRAVSKPISDYFYQLHTGAGVDVRLSSTVAGAERVGDRIKLTTGDSTLTADVVVVGVGVVPNDDLAAIAGLETSNGVVVDGQLRTTDENISAIGDCARFPHPASKHPTIRLESVQNAADHARHIAATIAGQDPSPYDEVPWFWTEQLGRKLQMAGLIDGYDRTETVDTAPDKFSVYCYEGPRLRGCESVNAPKDHLHARKQLAAERGEGAQAVTV
jgi:3-phenylpropionate/trans-cinnamate dioxygenase ferredoxin reductase component